MKFLIDAQLPHRFMGWLSDAGHDALHTLDLTLRNRTPDSDLVALAAREERVVVSKDDDFVQFFLVKGEPRLLLVSTGNICNQELEKLVRDNLASIEAAFLSAGFVELTHDTLIVHE